MQIFNIAATTRHEPPRNSDTKRPVPIKQAKPTHNSGAVLKSPGPKSMAPSPRNRTDGKLTMVEQEKGDRFLLPQGQAKALTGTSPGYNVVSRQQQSLESLGAIARKQDGFGIYYVGTKPAGVRFLKEHREVPQRNLTVTEASAKKTRQPESLKPQPKK